ncbi:MAG: hypothetical protein Kow0025_10620 [Thermodesulfovibrionales bacterium]
MPEKRRHRRFEKRLEVEFSAEGQTFTGISSNFSEKGLFIRTRRVLPAGTYVDVRVFLPGGRTAHLKAIVRRAVKASTDLEKNGMGVEVILKDDLYREFMKTLEG